MFNTKYTGRYRKIVQSESIWVKCAIALIFCMLAAIRYLYKLDARMAFEVDENLSFVGAAGFLKTGTFFQWDFTNNCISDIPCVNHKGYIVLLALWMKLFGISLMSARSLSVLLGCLFVISFVYISFELFKRWDITAIATSFVILEPNITYCFRFIQYYSAVIFLSIWMIYFAYKAIMTPNSFKKKGKLISFVEKNFDFNLVYVLAAIIIGCVSAKVHNAPQMVLFSGMTLFVIYKAVTGKEKKYILVSVIAVIMIVIGIGCIGLLFGEMLDKVPVIGYFMLSLTFGEQRNYEYYWDSVNALFNQPLLYMGWLLAVMLLFAKSENKDKKDKVIYLLLIQAVTFIFMIWSVSRYYQTQYLCFLLPVSILVFSVGIVEIMSKYFLADLAIGCLLIGSFWYIINDSYEYLYTLYTGPGSQKVYEIVNKWYPGEKNILGVDMDMDVSGYFACQYMGSVNYQRWSDYDTENAFAEVREFARQYPKGFIWVDKNQIFDRHAGQNELLNTWLDRSAGTGLDNYNIEVSVLNFLEPKRVDNREQNAKVELKAGIPENGSYYTIAVDGRKVEEDTQFICVRAIIERNAGYTEVLRFQLDIPEESRSKVLEYQIEIGDAKKVRLDNSYAEVKVNQLIVQGLE